MKNLFFVIILISATFLASAQMGVTVRFLYNGKNLDIEKELVNFSSRDTIQLVLESREPISVEEVRVQPFFAKFSGVNSGQQQVQTQQKVKLVQGAYKRFKGLSNQKRIVIKIPVRSFPGNNLSKLKLNMVNCTNKKGDKLIRSNKAFEIFSPLASRI